MCAVLLLNMLSANHGRNVIQIYVCCESSSQLDPSEMIPYDQEFEKMPPYDFNKILHFFMTVVTRENENCIYSPGYQTNAN